METTALLRDPVAYYGAPGPVMLNAAMNVQVPRLNIVNLSYTVKTKPGAWYTGACFKSAPERKVLKNIDMSLNSGEVTAIIGNSGCGKTTLLDVIACRVDGRVTGNIYFKNYVCSKTLMQSCTSYVIQADRLLPHLTIRETLRYTAYLNLPGYATDNSINSKVDTVIHQMGLTRVADSLVGGAVNRGISGGEKRRVSIAIQLLKDPDILLLDEPTTGLDSFTAKYLVKSLRELARSGKIVLMTIHQPRSDIFKLIDQTAILSQGEMAYFGRSDEIVSHFTRLNFPCPVYANPLDVYIDVCSVDRKTREREQNTKLRINDLVQGYRESPQHEAMVASMTDSQKIPKYINFQNKASRRNSPGVYRTFSTILSRMNKNLFRDPGNVLTRAISAPINMLFVFMYLGRLDLDQRSIQNRSGLFFQTMLFSQMLPLILTVFLYPPLRDLCYRERRDGLYSSWYFGIAYHVHAFPFHIISGLMVCAVGYWGIGLYSDFGYSCQYFVIHILLILISENITQFLMALVYDYHLVNIFTSMLFTLSLSISTGFFRTFKDLPAPLRWLSYTSAVKYGTEIITVNEYTNINITCDGLKPGVPCRYPSSQAFLDQNYPDAVDELQQNYGCIFGIYAGSLILCLLAYKLKKVPNLN
ncbi:hypothetical protein SNE40_010141 [Patella caerulea]|uniref:ABC transporter domain-containing protein n=1 Tax=Patella caerulea TaxID=87958 RepID=A0AAN8K055_PATCE